LTLEEEIVNKLKEKFGEKILEAKIQRARRIFITVDRSTYKDVIRFLRDNIGVTHVSTISGVDAVDRFEVIPHFSFKGVVISVRGLIPKDNPEIDTISDVIPGAFFYEKEVHEMFGININGHPDLSHLELPDEWPEGLYPLRKDVDLQTLLSKITKERD